MRAEGLNDGADVGGDDTDDEADGDITASGDPPGSDEAPDDDEADDDEAVTFVVCVVVVGDS